MEIKDQIDDWTLQLCKGICRRLKNRQKKLRKIKWSNGEANLDTEYSELAKKACLRIWEKKQKKDKNKRKVTLSVKIPDLLLTFTLPDKKEINKKIELKSSKSKCLPGSTIKNLDINMPMIFCLRPSKKDGKYILRFCQYYQAIGKSEYDLFQDRSPRPRINFDKMKNKTKFIKQENNSVWVDHYAKCANNRIKKELKNQSWQDDLTKKLKELIISEFIEETSVKDFKTLKAKLC